MIDTGALAACEAMIDSYTARSHSALESASISNAVKSPLLELAIAATARRV
jgi:geranylgeranyl diphosphate synthase type I